MNNVVEINNLRVEYPGRKWREQPKVAVDGLNMQVRAGEVFGFLGPNGAGKTTTMNVLLGFVNATGGSASIFGVDVRQPIARQRIGYLPELTYYYKFLNTEELLRFYARIFRIPARERDQRIDAVLKLVELESARTRLIKTYSKGMQQRVGLAQALINDPDLLILDEPTSGLDPLGRMKVREIIQRLKERGKTILFSSHELGEVETVCDRVAILHQGKLQVEGRVSDLVQQYGTDLEHVFLKSSAFNLPHDMNNVIALAGVVVKELYRRKDFYVLFVLTALITIMLGSVRFFNDDRIVRYLKEGCLLLVWISSLVIAITTAARQIPAERESRTIFPLLAKPVSRAELIAGKFLGCWLACGVTLVVFYSFFAVITGSREHAWPVAVYVQAMWLHWMSLGIVVALVLLGSVVFTAPSSNATISFIVVLGIMFCGRHLNGVAVRAGGLSGSILYIIYFCIPHLEWYDLRDFVVHDWGRISWLVCGEATLYGLLYCAFLLGTTWLVFRRKTLTV